MKKLKKVDLLIDIQAKIDQGKGAGYERWAKVFNVKQLANSLSYLSEHNIKSYDDLASKVENAVHENDELLEKVKAAESRLQEIGELKKAIYDYWKTREVLLNGKNPNGQTHFSMLMSKSSCYISLLKRFLIQSAAKSQRSKN